MTISNTAHTSQVYCCRFQTNVVGLAKKCSAADIFIFLILILIFLRDVAVMIRQPPGVLWWREKVQDATMSAGCAEMRKPRKIGGFIHFGETGDEPNTFYFYFQHNIRGCLYHWEE